MAIFLPALIFSDAMKMNIHLFKVCFWQCFLLASPGVLINCGSIALLGKYVLVPVFGYHWDWYHCFLFGSVLAATDPVSVVAMMESAQAPPKITMLMNGESHLADLTSLVLFNLFLGFSTGGDANPNTIASYTASMLFGGPLLGALFGFIALLAIRRNSSPQRKADVMIQIAITVIVAYMAFLVSENNLQGNGVLATVTAAVVIAAYAWPSFAHVKTMENVWHAVEYFGNTMIFLLSGLIYGTISYSLAGDGLNVYDIGVVFFVWISLYLIRLLIVVLFFPLLSRMGYGIRANESAIIIWGGLRGAVAMTLGVVALNSHVISLDFVGVWDEKKDLGQFFFLVGGVVFLSLAINSTTAPMLMAATKLLSRSQVKQQLLHQVKMRIRRSAQKHFDEVTKPGGGFEAVRIETVRYAVSSLRLKGEKTNWGENIRTSFHEIDKKGLLEEEPHEQLLEEVRELFLDAVRAQYWEQIEHGILPKNSSATQTLLQSTEIAKDYTSGPLCDFKYLSLPEDVETDEQAFHVRFFNAIDEFLPDWVTIDDYFGEKLHAQLRQDAVYASSCFIVAHEVGCVLMMWIFLCYIYSINRYIEIFSNLVNINHKTKNPPTNHTCRSPKSV